MLVGYSKITIVSDTFDWAGIGDANATFGIAGGQPIAGLSSIGWGSGLTALGAVATDSDTLAKTYQINEKLTWLKGRHTLKFGGQFLHYDQQRFYAGNNGLLGLLQLQRRVHRLRRSPTSCSTRCRARAAAAAAGRRGRTCRTASRSSSRTTSR